MTWEAYLLMPTLSLKTNISLSRPIDAGLSITTTKLVLSLLILSLKEQYGSVLQILPNAMLQYTEPIKI
jgi:hypothetical protein